MDENQLKYQRLLNYTDEELQYKHYKVVIKFEVYVKRIIVRACCEEEIRDTTHHQILSIKYIDHETTKETI